MSDGRLLPASGRTAGTCTVDVDRKDGRSPEPVREEGAEKLAAAFGIKTVRDLGSNKYFAVAQALVALGAHSG